MSHSHNALMRPLLVKYVSVLLGAVLLLPPRQQFKDRTVFPVPHLCIAPTCPWGWGRWKGLLACVMLDALLRAGRTFLPNCHIPDPTNCPPPLTSVLPPGAPGLWGGAGG